MSCSTLVDADPFADLNAAQRAAVDHGDAPLLVVAGAGTGKTATLAARVARLLRDGADPHRLLLLTFSRRAAAEMTRRAAVMLRQARGGGVLPAHGALPWAGTFHAVGARLLRELAPGLGLAPAFSIVDRGDAETLMAQARAQLGQAELPRRFPLAATCLAIHSRRVNAGEALEPVLRTHFPWCLPWAPELGKLFEAYAAMKQQQALLDYDDLLLYWAAAMDSPAVAAALRQRFAHVLVDEFQDSNRLQMQILRRLAPDGRGLTVVGDDAQSIYAFRGADWRQIVDFPCAFAPPARVVPLEQNYRSTPAILAACNAVMAEAAEGHAKTLWSDAPDGPRPAVVTVADEAAQADWIADTVLRLREEGLALRRQAVLFRIASHAVPLELELARRRIPFVKYGGLRFLETAHVKDLLSVLRWARNPRHALAAQRCVRLLPGFGAASARRLLSMLQDDGAEAVARFQPPAAARAGWEALQTLWTALHTEALGWPAAYDAALQWLTPALQRQHADAAARLADLRQLREAACAQPGCERFLAELTLDPPRASSELAADPSLDEDWLVLSSIHAAKGQEWAAVHVLGVVDGGLPADLATGSAAEIEEERRLLYVAMSRARQRLHLVAPQRFHVTHQPRWGAAHVQASLSRFLTPAVLACCDRIAPAPPADAAVPGLALPPGSVDFASLLRARGG